MQDAYENAVGEMGDREPSLLLVFMTANVDHAKALERLNEITKGEIPYSGKVCNLHNNLRLSPVGINFSRLIYCYYASQKN